MSTRLLLAAAAALTITMSAAHSATVFTATLDGSQSGTPSPGTGSGTFILDDTETSLSYTITFSGLLAPETVSHFHRGAPGVSGPVVKNLPLGSPKVGVWSAFDATQPLTPQAVADLKAGLLYINVHSSLYPAGEIRGQIVPEPSALLVLAGGGAGLLGALRRGA